MRLTYTDQACRKRVDELAGSGIPGSSESKKKVAADLARQSKSFEYQDRMKAAKAARVLASGITADVDGTTMSKKDAEALLKEIKKHTRSAYTWKSFGKGYKRYADELSEEVGS